MRRISARLVDLIDRDRDQMHPPPESAAHVGFSTVARLPRDYYLRVLGNDYSIDRSIRA